jgi:hypothetical protein
MWHSAVIVLISVFSYGVHGQTSSVKADGDSVLVKQLTDLEFTLNKLLVDRDFDTYATFLADDYVRISANGEMKNKEQVLQEFRASKPGDGLATPEVLQVRVYGTTAVMTIHLTFTRRTTGELIRESLLTKVFVLRNGRWFMVSNQGTSLGQTLR